MWGQGWRDADEGRKMRLLSWRAQQTGHYLRGEEARCQRGQRKGTDAFSFLEIEGVKKEESRERARGGRKATVSFQVLEKGGRERGQGVSAARTEGQQTRKQGCGVVSELAGNGKGQGDAMPRCPLGLLGRDKGQGVGGGQGGSTGSPREQSVTSTPSYIRSLYSIHICRMYTGGHPGMHKVI